MQDELNVGGNELGEDHGRPKLQIVTRRAERVNGFLEC